MPWRFLFCFTQFLALSGQNDVDELASVGELDAVSRRLAVIYANLPSTGISLAITASPGGEKVTAAPSSASAHAGIPLTAAEIRLTGGDTFYAPLSARWRLVASSVTRSDALSGACTAAASSYGLSVVNSPMASATGMVSNLFGNTILKLAVPTGGNIFFSMGGSFRLCYSADGAFGSSKTDVLPINLEVAGVYDSCQTQDCLANKRYNCYALKDAHSPLGSCAVSFNGTGQGFNGNPGTLTWSSLWSAVWDEGSGTIQSLSPQACGGAPDATVFCPTGAGCSGSSSFVSPEASEGNRVIVLPETKTISNVSDGYVLSACYCPSYNGCNHFSYYTQQIGVLYVFTAKVCMIGGNCAGSVGYQGVAPSHDFSVMVNCAPGGCQGDDANRIKLIDAHSDNNRPSWDALHGCHSATQTSLQTSVNCDSATSCTLSGGSREDRKFFGENSSVAFTLAVASGTSSGVTTLVYERANFQATKHVDICFCSESCSTATNWFKVGAVAHSPYRLLSVAGLVDTVNVPGTMGLYRSASDYNSLGLNVASVIKVLPDSSLEASDSRCRSGGFDLTLVPGFTDAASSSQYEGRLLGGDASQIVFDSGNTANTFTVTSAGPIAICYCPKSVCTSSDWVLAARYVIRGPSTGQSWTFSTGLAVKLTYHGFNLDNSNTLRLTQGSINCNENSNNPYTELTVQDGCPSSCRTMIQSLGASRMNLATQVLTHATAAVYVTRVRVLSDTLTEVEFGGNPGLSTGDLLVLTGNIQCDANCDQTQLAEVSGRYPFGNSGSYDLGHAVTATSNVNRFTISIGWSGTVPKFEVVSGAGHWKRSSVGSTAEELKGTAAVQNLNVCWGYSGDSTYVASLGTVTFVSPPTLVSSLTLSGREMGKMTKVIITIETGNLQDYETTTDSMLLKLVFANANILEPHFTNGFPVSALVGWDEQELAKASQAACGKLFHELWSKDDPLGFPMPKGCYFKSYSNSQELFMVFEKKNGLQISKNYQIVLSATPKTSIVGNIGLLQVFSLKTQYDAVESGNTAISQDSLPGPDGTPTSPQFANQNGFTIISGTNALYELVDQLDLRFQLAGLGTIGIRKANILRIFMWPLTQWSMGNVNDGGSSCTVVCTPYPATQCPNPEGCTVEATVSGEQRNIIKISMAAADLTNIAETNKPIFHLTGLSIGNGGFFATRVGAQVSTSVDTNPDYIVSSGDYLWKQTPASTTTGELVITEGDGNSQPFQGDSGNVLHVHLILGAILFGSGLDGYASLTIRMPPGYECTQVMATPRNLGIFDTERGHGSFAAGKWLCADNVCTYTLDAFGIVFAKSSLYVSFKVNNPKMAMQQNDASNLWYVGINGAGQHTTAQDSLDVSFEATSASFTNHVAVLGDLKNVLLQPSNFKPSATHALAVFFETQQSAGFAGKVVLDAPEDFEFGVSCLASDLDSAYYSITTQAHTYPLPHISTCQGTLIGGSSTKNRATVHFTGRLRAGRRYAFTINVQNPSSYNLQQQKAWYLYTQTSQLHYVDGTSSSLDFQLETNSPLGPNSASSWGMYQEALVSSGVNPQVSIQVAPLLPYSLTNNEATVTVFPLKTPADVHASLRIIAPYGYLWFFSNQDFVYQHYTSPSLPGVVGATADLPGKIPQRDGNIIEWAPATYVASQTYGFSATIRVPDFTPTYSLNAYFVEFGFKDSTWGANDRTAAAVVPAGQVRALRNARVNYATRVKGGTNTVLCTIETATAIPFLGAVLIFAPKGFLFPESCQQQSVTGSLYQSLPDDASCEFHITSEGDPQISIVAGETGIPAALYAFEITGTNPLTPTEVYSGETTECGTNICWIFSSVDNARNGVLSNKLDKHISVTGFAITDQMPSAMILALDETARIGSGRDDKPLQQNWLAFAFKLAYDMTEPGIMTLRGPTGVVFTEDCLASAGVRTLTADIFGGSTTVMEGHSAWEPGVPILSCEGEGSSAQLDIGSGLKRLKSYVFSIRLAANPEKTPEQNNWVIELPQESSAPFDGFNLWTFIETSVSPLSTTMGTAPSMENLVNISFRPYTDLWPTQNSGGVLIVIAPSGFEFVSGCNVHMEENDPLWPEDPPVVFPSTDITCLPNLPITQLGIVLSSSRHVFAKRHYIVMARVYNPSAVVSPATWELKSYQDNTLALLYDTATIPGFATNLPMNTWTYAGNGVENGGVQIENFRLTLAVPEMIYINDQLIITAPPGYDLGSPSNQESQVECNSLIWGPGNPAPISVYSRATCSGNRLTVLILEDNPINNATTITMTMSIRSPLTLPGVALNYWHATHIDTAGAIRSSDVFQGWQVLPQLEYVQALIVGADLSAGSTSALEFRFVAVSNAVAMSIEAKQPAGFDFSHSTVPLADQDLLDSVTGLIRVSVTIAAGNVTRVQVANVKFAGVGGATVFDIQTFASSGSVADQKIGFAGFRLPSSITVASTVMQSEYALSPSIHPVASRWPPQLGKSVYVSFTLTFYRTISAGHLLQVKCPSYTIHREPFLIVDVASNAAVLAEVEFASGSELHVGLQTSLMANLEYRVSLQATSPLLRPTSDTWTVQIVDGGELPLAHSFVVMDTIAMVSSLGFSVAAVKIPPAADVEVSLVFLLGSVRPPIITIIAPPTYIFKPNCLVVGGAEITSCSPGSQIAGRPTAQLQCDTTKLTDIIQGVKILVTTPAAAPTTRSWFAEGSMSSSAVLGWGTDSNGFTIQPMQDVSFVYAGAQDTISLFAMSFRTSETINRGGKINVMIPDDFITSCSGSTLEIMSLPGVLECDLNKASVNLTLNDTMTPGDYGFGLTVRTPNATPASNMFSLLLRDERGKVQDAVMNILGRPIHDLSVMQRPLRWTSSQAGQASTITIGFTVSEPISAGVLGAVLITFPENFGHSIESEDGLNFKESELPLRDVVNETWLDFSLVDRLVILLDETQAVTAGDYEMKFLVTVPEQMPAFNVWQLTLCASSSVGVCTVPESSHSRVTFPLAGFYHGEVAPGLDGPTSAPSAAHALGYGTMAAALRWLCFIVALMTSSIW